ncbi:MAG: alpha-ketoacid dehydrogenase subunit beta, partial [Candidatus Tectimicrobiota bacterium]
AVCLLGEDVGAPGGPFGATQGLLDRFGPERVRDTPISEAALAGLATGAAMLGIRPVIEIMFFDFILLALDQLVNHTAKMRFMSGGVHKVPLTVITACGARRNTGPQHSQTFDAMLGNIPGLRVVWPSTPADAKGLLKSAIRCDDPVVFIESLNLWRLLGDVAEEEYMVPLGQANVVREGMDLTLVGVGSIMPTLLQVADRLGNEGISCEVIDLRSLAPLDLETIAASVSRTGRLVVAHDSPPALGLGAALVGHLAEPLFGKLRSAPRVVAPPGSPAPFNPSLEDLYYPDVVAVAEAIRATL